MDRGEAFKHPMNIIPAEEGSFVVHVNDQPFRGEVSRRAFTNISDLLDWLVSHAQAFSADKIADQVTHELTEGDVVKPGTFREYDPKAPPKSPRSLESVLASGNGNLRRTSSAEKMFPFTGMSAAAMQKLRTQDHFVADFAPEPPTAA